MSTIDALRIVCDKIDVPFVAPTIARTIVHRMRNHDVKKWCIVHYPVVDKIYLETSGGLYIIHYRIMSSKRLASCYWCAYKQSLTKCHVSTDNDHSVYSRHICINCLDIIEFMGNHPNHRDYHIVSIIPSLVDYVFDYVGRCRVYALIRQLPPFARGLLYMSARINRDIMTVVSQLLARAVLGSFYSTYLTVP